VHAWMNQRGAPDAVLVLTQRELSVINNWTETTGVMLMLDWRHWNGDPGNPVTGSTAWFDEQKMRQLGFDLRVPANAPAAERLYAMQSPRHVYVALEYNGPAWERWWTHYVAYQTGRPAGAAGELDAQIRNEEATMSRLMEIDAGLDPGALRQAHP